MKIKKLTPEQKASLEFRTDLAYGVLKTAVETRKEYMLYIAKTLYQYVLGEYLGELIKPTNEIVSLHKGGDRMRGMEAEAIQFLLMSDSYPRDSGNWIKTLDGVDEEPNDGMGGLKAWIDSKEPADTRAAVVLRSIQNRGREIRNDYQFNLIDRHTMILAAMDYVRGGTSGSSEEPLY